MRNFLIHKILQGGLLLLSMSPKAQPVAFGTQVINGCKIYKDAKAAHVFYYLPFDYKLSTNKNGKPSFSLLQMRYTGTQASGDKGSIRFRNILQFKMNVDAAAIQQLAETRTILKRSVPNLLLKPLPVTKFESLLVYSPVNNADSSLKLFTNGYTEGSEETSATTTSYWSERTFSIRLSDEDAQLMEAALKVNGAAISMSYAFFTTFSGANAASVTATVNSRISKKVMDYFSSSVINNTDTLMQNVLVKADAVAISIDTERWPDAVQKIDINEKLPPAYPLFDVYCYDFNNAIRPDLYAKRIEISATSVNGNLIHHSSLFKQSQPELYVRSIRFPYAVRFDKPYKYRTTEINLEGEVTSSGWMERHSWNDIIDITTPQNK
jgi:hypothetical protein